MKISKRVSGVLAGVLIAIGGAMGAAMAAPQVGKAAPLFSGTTSTGQTIELSQFAGKKVVLEWTNHECPYVQKHYDSGNMQALQKKNTASDTVWISVISSAPGNQGHVSADRANALSTDRKAAPTHILLDESGAVGRLYKAEATPHMFVIDGDQTLRYAGAIDSIRSSDQADVARADNYVAKALQSLRSGKPIVTPQTRPYGCTVKYGPQS
ncbi:MAG: redoxin domain-containing protein [Pseudomonadota bacterium]